jgi:hypothetical protein
MDEELLGSASLSNTTEKFLVRRGLVRPLSNYETSPLVFSVLQTTCILKSASSSLFFLVSLENPLNTISIIKLPIRSEWHIMQLLKPLFFCSFCKFVKNHL